MDQLCPEDGPCMAPDWLEIVQHLHDGVKGMKKWDEKNGSDKTVFLQSVLIMWGSNGEDLWSGVFIHLPYILLPLIGFGTGIHFDLGPGLNAAFRISNDSVHTDVDVVAYWFIQVLASIE